MATWRTEFRLTAAAVAAIAGAAGNAALADSCAAIDKAAAAYAGVERFAVDMTMVSRGQTHRTEVLVAPEGMFIKAGEQWIRSPVAIDRRSMFDAAKTSYRDCALVGRENVGGVPTAVWRFVAQDESSKPVRGRMWIGTADDLPRRVDVKSEEDGDITQLIRYDVKPPQGAAGIPGLDRLKGLFGGATGR